MQNRSWLHIILTRYKREISATLAYILLLLLLAVLAPSFFTASNWRDLLVNNVPVLIVAIGMTLVILVAEIDISVGSQFAVCSVAAGLIAKTGISMLPLLFLVLGIGAILGCFNGLLIAELRLPSIVVTLAMLVAWRDALLWCTQGAWIQGLPDSFQWFGFNQRTGAIALVSISIFILLIFTWGLRNLVAGRAIYAVGSDSEAARLSGIAPATVVISVFVTMGVLTALAALLNAVRFSAVPSNVGVGLELKAIAAVVVGGTAITGGRGNLFGTFIGTALLGTIGTALTFLGINPFWEKAIQGAIILVALASDIALESLKHVKFSSARGIVRQN